MDKWIKSFHEIDCKIRTLMSYDEKMFIMDCLIAQFLGE